MSLLCGPHLTQKKNWSPHQQPPSSIWSGQSVPLLYYFLLLLSVLWKTDFLAIPWTCKERTCLRTFALAGFSHGVSFPQLPAWLFPLCSSNLYWNVSFLTLPNLAIHPYILPCSSLLDYTSDMLFCLFVTVLFLVCIYPIEHTWEQMFLSLSFFDISQCLAQSRYSNKCLLNK